MLKARIQKHRGKPQLFHDKCPGFFYVHYTQHTGPTALRPIRRTKQLWLSVLLKDTSAATGQAGIRTNILTTPELESNALDRSATTLSSVSKIFLFHFQLQVSNQISTDLTTKVVLLCIEELQQFIETYRGESQIVLSFYT